MSSISQDEWIAAFNLKLKQKSFEQFSILLFDLNQCGVEQKQLLYPILFQDHKSVYSWEQYILYCIGHFPEKKLQVQRLISKGLEVLDAEALKDDPTFLKIQLIQINLRRLYNLLLIY